VNREKFATLVMRRSVVLATLNTKTDE
jgi:hypothetical protein